MNFNEFKENAIKYYKNEEITKKIKQTEERKIKMKLYAIKDKMGEFNTPFASLNNATATRSFGEACNNPQSNIYKIARDMELYLLADYELETGKITNCEVKKIADGAEYVASRTNEK